MTIWRTWAWLVRYQPARAAELRQLPWIADGVNVSEQRAAEDLIRAARWYPDTFNVLMEMPWLQDAITVDETRAIYGILGAAWLNLDFAERLLQKHWIQDDITRDEGIIIRRLYWLVGSTDEATRQRDVTISIIDMPFLDDMTFAEARAVMSLDILGRSRSYQDIFPSVMSHPKVQDGITDKEAKVIAVLRSPAKYQPDAIPSLLDGLDGTGGVYLEERTIQLPLTGETLLAIVRTQDQTTASMDYLEHAVRFAEKFVTAPLPTNYVALYFGDLGSSAGARNSWTHMAMRQSLDGLDEYADTIAHEVGHYYFRDSGAKWINEGTVDLLSFASEYERAGYPFERHMKNRRCDSSVKTLAASELIEDSGCARNLGERFFTDLYRILGEDDFLKGYRALYQLRIVDNPDDDCDDCTAINVHHVLEAFTSGFPEDVADKAKEVLLKWYGPLPRRNDG